MNIIVAYSGIVKLNRKYLEKQKADHQKVSITMTGLLIITKDVSPELAYETIGELKIKGIVKASNEVKGVLNSKRTV